MQSKIVWNLLAPFVSIALCSAGLAGTITIGFDDLSLAPGSFYNGGPSTNSTGWSSGGAAFQNDYSADWGGYWSGWSYSNVNAPTTAGYQNQYASSAGLGLGVNGIYAMASGDGGWINLPANSTPQSVSLTNAAYAAQIILNGDDNNFARSFSQGDFFSVKLTGWSGLGATGTATGSQTFYLADYRSSISADRYVVQAWTPVDLTGLGNAQSLNFVFDSTDEGAYGINTPTYVAMDNLTVATAPVPEPATATLLLCGGLLGVAWYRATRATRYAPRNYA